MVDPGGIEPLTSTVRLWNRLEGECPEQGLKDFFMNCTNCKLETTNPKFCSRSCNAKYHNTRVPKRKLMVKLCTKCNSKIDRRSYLEQSKLCGQCRYAENIKNRTLAEYYSLGSIKNKHPSWRNAHIRVLNRSWNRDLTKLPCAICKYSKHVELAHIKSITSFTIDTKLSIVNSKSNVIQLCRNCHWELDHNMLDISQLPIIS